MTQPFFDTLKVKKLHPNAKLPTRAHESDAGNDLYSLQDYRVAAGAIQVVRTGVGVQLPTHSYGRVADRSSMAVKGWRVGAGVIDHSYTGPVDVVLQNMTTHELCILAGQKVAQLIVTPVFECDIEEVADLATGARGASGFGSSGL